VPPGTLPPAEALNGLVMVGTNDFTVGGGGGGIIRFVQPYADLQNTIAAFLGQPGQTMGGVVVGSGVGVPVNATINKPGFTSDNLMNGTFLVGIAASSSNGDPGLGNGNFRTSALNWSVYTGADVPNPPPGTATGKLTNPATNQDGSKLPGGQFSGIEVQMVPTNNLDPFVVASWSLSGGGNLTFAANGFTTLNQNIGAPEVWKVNCGLININAATPPGLYRINCSVGVFPGAQTVNLTTNLLVGSPSQGGFFMEF